MKTELFNKLYSEIGKYSRLHKQKGGGEEVPSDALYDSEGHIIVDKDNKFVIPLNRQ